MVGALDRDRRVEREKLMNELNDYAKQLIESEYGECGLKEDILDEIQEALELAMRWRYSPPSAYTPKSNLIQWGLKMCEPSSGFS